ncbi:hypothetical protein BB558_002561 [Smittium angustum]|uniref:B30.2/SPRY domain-containing protein n=1 Tax=Smittium angustum TaxID=133377 RepID=A0A2U1J8D6_SMIAN|nr:hypothetical protein BB558_002561 [Smittium angustum]
MDEDSLETIILYISLGSIIGVLVISVIFVCIQLLRQEYGILSIGNDSDTEELDYSANVDEAQRQRLMENQEFRQSYELGQAFERQYPYGSMNTQITPEQQTLITEKGVSAWEFSVESEENVIVNDKADLQFLGGDNLVQTNIPIPKKNSVYYFETKITELTQNTNIYIGLATKPYPSWRMVGFNKYSVGYHINTGYVYQNSVFKRTKLSAKCKVGDIIGIGYNPKIGCAWFSFNGKRLSGAFTNLEYNIFPTISTDGPCGLSVNFGQRGYVFIEANVKKWGFAPIEGSQKPPPKYGNTGDSVLLELGVGTTCELCRQANSHTNECSARGENSNLATNTNSKNNTIINIKSSTSDTNNPIDLLTGGGAGSFFGTRDQRVSSSSNNSNYQMTPCPHTHPRTNFPPDYEERDPIALMLFEAGNSSLISNDKVNESSSVQTPLKDNQKDRKNLKVTFKQFIESMPQDEE